MKHAINIEYDDSSVHRYLGATNLAAISLSVYLSPRKVTVYAS